MDCLPPTRAPARPHCVRQLPTGSPSGSVPCGCDRGARNVQSTVFRRFARCLPVALMCLGLLGAAPPGFDRVEAGDAAWDDNDRRAAREHWREASTSPSEAVAAMAELRLLQVSGSPGLVLHWIRMQSQRAACSSEDVWCLLVEVDRQLFLSRVGLPHNRRSALAELDRLEQAPQVAADPSLREAVTRRRTWLGTADQPGMPPRTGPGTWTVGVSPLGSTGLGGGAAVGFSNPDVGLRGGRLSVRVGATNRGNLLGSIAYNAPGRFWWHGAVRASRYERVMLATAGETATESWKTLTAEVGPGLRGPKASIWLGPVLLSDAGANAGAQTSGGVEVSARTRLGPSRSSFRMVAAAGDYRLATGLAQVRVAPSSGRVAVRLAAAPTAASPEAPAWRVPGWGGGVVLRHGSWQSLRHPLLAGATVELRTPRAGPFQATVYGEGAVGGQPVAGFGTGLLVGLPPSPQNPFRVDVAWGSLGLGISTGWGRAF